MRSEPGHIPYLKAMSWWFGGNLLYPIRVFSGAVIIAAGPWLVAVMALSIVSVTIQPVLGSASVEDLRLTVVYAFCIAPLVAGPLGAVAGRLIGAEVDAGNVAQTPAIFVAAALGSAFLAELFAILLVVVLGVAPYEIALAFVFLTGAAALLWTSFAALAALKAYALLIWSFSAGMALALLCIMLAARGDIDTEILIWSFSAGISLSVCISLIKVRRVAGGASGDIGAAVVTLWRETSKLRLVALGVVFAILAAWIDKWIYWITPAASRSSAGFAHYSPYDSVMFVAHLSAIPSYAALLIFHDTELLSGVNTFRSRLQDGSTRARIRSSVDALGRKTWSGIFTIVFLQAAFTACMVLMSPAFGKFLHFSFDQLMTLRVGLIGVFFQAFFYLSCAVILVCNRAMLFMLLQAGFLVCNLVASYFFYYYMGMTAYAFFCSALVSAVAAFFVAYRALSDFDYLTFIGENDSLYGRAG